MACSLRSPCRGRILPGTREIVANLTRIANEASAVAVAWHVVIALVGVAFAFAFRPSVRVAAVSLGLPLASVSILAWVFGNPFNGAVFALITTALTALALGGASSPVARGPDWSSMLGVLLVAFGWAYPHFLDGSPLVYLYRAPTGTVPCPTLALVCGLALVGGGLVGGAWRLLLASTATCYALFGALRLGVAIDWILLAGALGLLVQHFLAPSRRAQLRCP